jgi:4-hydroxy-tetrahydrodipicolinate synthase
MTDIRTSLHGLWLPLVTPFRNGELDEASLRRMVRHYADLPVDGLVLAATTGEGLTLDPSETERLVRTVRDEIGARNPLENPLEYPLENLPVCLGLSGSNTSALLETLQRTASWPIEGYLISCPYYSRPSQRGLEQHFGALADRAAHPVMLYNIPYRTGVNLGNDAMLRLAAHPNIVGLKDCSADGDQSRELLRRRPHGFAVLTGEDRQYQDALADGADGGILASAHIETESFAQIWKSMAAGEHEAAAARWRSVADLVRLLFAEPSPAPIKYWLWHTGLIDSAEVRLPMTEVSPELAARLDREIERRSPHRQYEKPTDHANARPTTGSATNPSGPALIQRRPRCEQTGLVNAR